jgi:hypothetical protein
VNIDDLNNPNYRKGRHQPAQGQARAPLRPRQSTEAERRARFAEQTARAEFGRFYWNGELSRRMQRELAQAIRCRRKAAAQARSRKRDGGGR